MTPSSLLAALPSIAATAIAGLATLHAQVAGTLDPAFIPVDPQGGTLYINAAAVRPDGKIIIGGGFNNVGGQPRRRIARPREDGTLESTATFDIGTGPDSSVSCVAVQADGKILICGTFITVNGQTRRDLARLEANGAVESTATFNPVNLTTGSFNPVRYLAVQPDGKILIAGDFTTVNGLPRTRLARLNADGTVEDTATFNPGTGPNSSVFCMTLQGDGKILIGGSFSMINGQSRPKIARLNADGTVESTATFNVGTGPSGGSFFGRVHGLAVQANGTILIGGDFTTVNGLPHNFIARLNADGSVENTTTFNAGTGATGAEDESKIRNVALEANGRILLGGFFTSVNGQARNSFCRLANDAATESLSIPDSTQVQWMRGGSGPEVGQASFEVSTDGGANWTPLGPGTRIPGGWQRTGLSLPGSGSIRACGHTSGGGVIANSSGLVEQIGMFDFSPPDAGGDGLLDAWEIAQFGTTAGHSASDDFDHDGYNELLELAFGGNPTEPDVTVFPGVTADGGFLTVTLTKRPGVTYQVQSGADPADGSFSAASTTVLIDNATTLTVRDNSPIASSARRFMLVKVTAAP
jgi:uncharacterized delta-60 repeat protein